MANNSTLDALIPRGLRNYNPGNIVDSPFARRQPGYKGSDGRFAIFDSLDNGIGAQTALLGGYGKQGLNTLNAIVNRWAPAAGGNNPTAYAATVGKKLGIDPNQPLDMSDPNVLKNIAMGMGEYENGQKVSDPRSWMASAAPQTATGAPMALPGAGLAGGTNVSPEAPMAAQSFSLGDQENQQPLNNIGSTLANMGASIASLDNRGTGIASLNASRVASNLAQQEQQRASEGGWKYAGQTQNGQGLMFQNSKGEVRVEPLAPGFTGEKEPEAIRTLKMLQANPSLLETKKEMNGDSGQDTVLTDEGVESAVEAKFAGRKDAYTGMTKKGRELAMNKEAEFKKKYGVTDEDIMSNQGKWAGVFGAEREYSKRVAMVGTAERSLSAAIEQGRGLLQDPEVKNMLNQPRLINQFNQLTAEQLNTEGLGKLAKLKENFETVAQDYTRVNAMGGSTTTVRAQDIARGILNTGMSDKAINELFDYMGQTGLRVKDALNAGQEELRANARKHTRIEDYQKSQAASEKAIADRLDKDMVRFGLKPKDTIRDSEGSQSKRLKYNPQTGELE